MPHRQFHIPVLPDILTRPRLYQTLSACPHCRIILVTGQAAQGKTTLIADYLKRDTSATLWFHLKPSSSDSGTLFNLICQGIESLNAPCGQAPALPHVSLGTRQDLHRQSEILVSAMNQIAGPLNIVLDDMQSIAPEAPALALIQTLLAESPGHVKFFLLSRTLPGLNLSRFKITQELLEIGNQDLAFTREEIQAFFTETAQTDLKSLDSTAAQKVLDATSGWAGGLILVSEATRHSCHLNGLPEQISAKVIPYFHQEIYQNLAPEIQTFLRQTALFDELDTRMLSSIFPQTDPVDMLSRLEQRNLFIQKIIPYSQWPVFRYNNMFREFLLADLNQTFTPPQIKMLNQQIGQAFWDKKDHERAIRFFMAAGDFDMVAKILKIKGVDYVVTGRTDRLSQWIDLLPEFITLKDPWLILFRTMADRIRGGKKNIQTFSRTLAIFRQQDETRGILLSLACLIEASVFVRQPPQALLAHIRAGETAMAGLGNKYRFTWTKSLLWQQIGLGYIAGTGDIPKGISACRNAILLAQGIQDPALVLSASVILTLGLVQSGDFPAARHMLEKTRAISKKYSQPEYRALGNITNIDLALKRGDIGLAGDFISQSEADIEKFGLIFLYPAFVEARALYHAYSDRYDQAVVSADHLSDFAVLTGNDFYQGISHRVKAAACLLNKDPDNACIEAKKAVNELKRSHQGEFHIFQARQIYGIALFLQGQHRDACRELEAVQQYFKQIHSSLSLCETDFILGAARYDCGNISDRKKAVQYFTQGFETAVKNQYYHFPLLDATLMAGVTVRAWETLADSETILIPFIKRFMSPQTRAAVRKILSGKSTRKDAERFTPLFRAVCPEIFISTLGPFSIRQDHSHLPISGFGGPKPLMLLKALLLHGSKDVPKEVLVDILWPGTQKSAGERNLKINIHRIRKALEPFAVKQFGHVYLIQKAGKISLAPDLVTVDTTEFTALVRQGRALEAEGDIDGALACYTKTAGLYKGNYFTNDPYLEGIVQNREMYQRTCIDILERSAEIYQTRDLWQKTVDAWHRILEIDACHEAACRHLMIRYKDVGMKTEALQVYAKCRKALEEELDIAPNDRTRKIYNQLV